MINQLNSLLKTADITLTERQKEQLLLYVALLIKWNNLYNLTAIRQPEQILIKHILDSLVISPFLQGKNFIDVGTGAGLPGIPLAIINPDRKFTLLDSLGKRVRFLRQVQHELQLNNIIPVQSRVEKFVVKESFDGVISRAFTSLQEMLCWCDHLVKRGEGHFYALKGLYPTEELKNMPIGFKATSVIPLKVPLLDEERHLVIIIAD